MNWNIRTKIAVVLILLILTGFLSWLTSFQFIELSRSSLNDVKNAKLKHLLIAHDADNNFENYINSAVVAVSTKEPQVIVDNKFRIDSIKKNMALLEKQDPTYKSYVLFVPLLEEIHEVSLLYIRGMFKATDSDRKVTQEALKANSDKIENVKKSLRDLKQKAEDDFDAAAEHTNQLNSRFVIISGVTLAGLILVVIFFAIVLLSSILKRISRLKEHFGVINIDSLEPIQNTGEDELGDLLKASNKMLMNIKEARSELIEKHFVENIINTLNDILLVCDSGWKIIRINTEGLEFFKEYGGSPFGKDIFEFLEKNENRMGLAVEEMKFELIRKGILEGEAFLKSKNTLIPVHVSAAAMTPTVNFNNTFVFIIRDLSSEIKREEEKQVLQAHLTQSAKLASLGTLGAGIAHELANPLSAIMGYAELLKNNKDLAPTKIQDFGNTIIRCGKRMTGIIDEFRKFSRDTSELNFEVFPIHLTIEGVLVFMQHKIASMGVDIQLDFDKKDSFILGDHNQIESVFLNLFTNSCDSFEEVTDERKKVIKVSNRIEGDIVVIIFEDNAMGIPEEKVKNIFDPFFTTKPVGSGTGLGLFIVHQILKNHNCTIEVSSKIGEGTRFVIRFPKASPAKAD